MFQSVAIIFLHTKLLMFLLGFLLLTHPPILYNLNKWHIIISEPNNLSFRYLVKQTIEQNITVFLLLFI